MKIAKGVSRSSATITPLLKGDKCVLIKHHGTVAFIREGEPLRKNDGDDKFILHPHDLVQFDEVVQMVAGAAALTAVLEGDQGGYVTYRFE